jgi:hypothetical protein
MRKFIAFVIFAMIATVTFSQTQYSVRRIVRAQFVAGTITVPNDTMCANTPSQQITGTPATGGKPTPANTYQWQYWSNTNPVWTNGLGATGLDLQTGILAPGQHQYRRIDNNPGCGSIDTTNTIIITVWNNFLAGIATGGGNFCNGALGTPTTCTAATGGDPATITQVVQTSPDGLTWTTTGNTTLSYTPAGAMLAKEYVRWMFTSNCGIQYSNVILYNVYLPFVAGTISTTTVTPLCNGANAGTATATVATGGSPTTTVEWETSPDGLTWTNTGNTTITLVLGNLITDKYARIRYINGSCGTLWSNTLYFQVYPVLAHGGTPAVVGNDTICLNTDPGMIDAPTAIGGTGVYTYQWQNRINGSSWSNVLGATSEDYDVPALNIAGLYNYQRIATDACGNVTSPMVSILVYPALNAGVVGNHEDDCSGFAQSAIIELTPASGGSGVYTYQWIVSTDNEVTWNNAPGVSTNSTYTPATTSTPVDIIYDYRRWVTDVNACGAAPSTAPALP